MVRVAALAEGVLTVLTGGKGAGAAGEEQRAGHVAAAQGTGH